jgi:hypothetical protein
VAAHVRHGGICPQPKPWLPQVWSADNATAKVRAANIAGQDGMSIVQILFRCQMNAANQPRFIGLVPNEFKLLHRAAGGKLFACSRYCSLAGKSLIEATTHQNLGDVLPRFKF